jgi:hypothetical protein
LDDWENMFPVEKKKKSRNGFLTVNTCTGFRVTLKATLELLEYLTKECGYRYLMTSRLNQDNLEVRPLNFLNQNAIDNYKNNTKNEFCCN